MKQLQHYIRERTEVLDVERQKVLLTNMNQIVSMTFQVDTMTVLPEETRRIAKQLCDSVIDAVFAARNKKTGA